MNKDKEREYESARRKELGIDGLLEQAKRYMEDHCGGDLSVREWLEATPPDSYGDCAYRASLYVLSGSPPKGYIILDWEYPQAKTFTAHMAHMKTFRKKSTGSRF